MIMEIIVGVIGISFIFPVVFLTLKTINAILIGILGICLSIALPIPLGGFLGCLIIFILCIGILNDDGTFIITSYFLSLVYITLLIILTYKYIN